MTGTLILFLPAGDGAIGWLRLDGDAVVARGESLEQLVDDALADRIVAVAPAEAVALHAADLAGLSTAQARAAARLLIAENSIAPVDTLHVALGGADEDRVIAAVDAGRMAEWLTMLQAAGLDPHAVVPAPLLAPRPDEGYVRAQINGAALVRGRSSGWADDPVLTPLLVGDAPVETVAGDDLVRAMAVAATDPPVDLRQGRFARRQRWRIDWALVRRLAWLGAGIAAVTLLISLAAIVRYSFATDAIALQAENAARAGLPRGEAADPVAALDDRLTGLRGGGLGFSATTGLLFGAVQATPNLELAALDFTADGMLRATILAPGAPEAEALLSRIRQSGLSVEASPFQAEGGRIRGEFRISAS